MARFALPRITCTGVASHLKWRFALVCNAHRRLAALVDAMARPCGLRPALLANAFAQFRHFMGDAIPGLMPGGVTVRLRLKFEKAGAH